MKVLSKKDQKEKEVCVVATIRFTNRKTGAEYYHDYETVAKTIDDALAELKDDVRFAVNNPRQVLTEADYEIYGDEYAGLEVVEAFIQATDDDTGEEIYTPDLPNSFRFPMQCKVG